MKMAVSILMNSIRGHKWSLIITDEKLQSIYAYIDYITVYSYNKTNHDCNFKYFMAAVEK